MFLNNNIQPTGTQWRFYRRQYHGTHTPRQPPNCRLVEYRTTRRKSTNCASSGRGCDRKVATPVPRADCEETFDGLVDRLVSEERPASRILSTQSRSLAWLDDIVHDHFASIPSVVEDTAVLLLNDAGRATESRPDIEVLAEICTVVNL